LKVAGVAVCTSSVPPGDREFTMACSAIRARVPHLRTAILLSALMTLGIAVNASAATADQFSALFDVKDVTPIDRGHVSLTLTLRLTNQSGENIVNGQVALLDQRPPRQIGTFPVAISLPNLAVTKLSGTFVVPTAYVKMWRSAPSPRVIVTYLNAHGAMSESPVRLAIMRGAGG
jgi:hypothetical protein